VGRVRLHEQLGRSLGVPTARGFGLGEAILPSSVISLRWLGGSPDQRVPCVFGQRLKGNYSTEGSMVAFFFALALRVRRGRSACRPASRQVFGSATEDAAPPTPSGPLEAATVYFNLDFGEVPVHAEVHT
jgi:hypothetical protein